MSCLTESSLTFVNIENSGSNNKNKNNNWYDRVYLCLEDTDFTTSKNINPIKGFRCYKYNSLLNVYAVWNNNLTNYQRHAIIPICKWVPNIFDRYILNYKLKNIYWLGNHIVCNGYKK